MIMLLGGCGSGKRNASKNELWCGGHGHISYTLSTL